LIEQALYFAIGFLAAALAAVAAAPLVSRRAMRLAMARARLRAPVTEKQAIADMDALRGQHAVEQARVERRLTLAEEISTGLRTAVGRQSSEILRLRANLADREGELWDQRAESEKLASHGRDLEATVGATLTALDDAFVQRDRASAAQEAAEARLAELEADASRDRARVAVLAARAQYLEGRLEEHAEAMKAARGVAATTKTALEAERARSGALDGRLANTADANRNLAEQLSRAQAARHDLAVRIVELEERLLGSERTREETLLENGRQLAALDDRSAALAAATARAAEFEARLGALAAESYARENASSLRLETLGAAQAAMEGFLRTVQAERETLQRENESLRKRLAELRGSSGPDVELRESISRLGREVVRLFSAPKGAEESNASAPEDRKPSAVLEAAAPTLSGDGEARTYDDGVRPRARRSRSTRP
jgi:chromosome segregation ATPase